MTGRNAASLAVYSVAHAVVDAICAGVLLTLWQRNIAAPIEFGALFALYNFLAFATQPLLGLLVDRLQRPRTTAIIGGTLVALATIEFVRRPLLSVCVAGMGNALFHLGAGTIAIRLTPGRATAPGIFVAPGDIGVMTGTMLGMAGKFMVWPFVAGLALLSALAAALPVPEQSSTRHTFTWRDLIPLVLLLACVAVRSMVGFSLVLPWKTLFGLAVALSVLVMLGKGVGGVLADRFGWGRIAVGALLVATPLLAFGAHLPAPGLLGVFLFNFTMPVTLVATVGLFPQRPAFAFGLTCLALEVGARPVLAGAAEFGAPWILFALGSGAAAALYLALRRCWTFS